MAERRRPDAILVVHGIGEQVSNDTARSLAVALADPRADRVRSSADTSIDGAKQRVYSIVWDVDSTKRSPESRVSEGYWAYRFRDTTWSHLTGWLLPLVRRPRSAMPDHLTVAPTWLSRLVVAAASIAALLTVVSTWAGLPLGGWLANHGVTAGAVVAGAVLLLWLAVLAPERAGPAVGLAIGANVLFAASAVLFTRLEDWTRPSWLASVPVAVLVLLVLIALAVDAATSVRVLATVTVTVMLVLVGTATAQDDTGTTVLALLATAAAPWLSAAATAALLPSLGDAARYFNDHPSNETESRDIRKVVIERLRQLHELDDNGEPRFERVVVIGHSLGSVIAYDAVNHYWSQVNGSITVGGRPDCDTCAARDTATAALEDAAEQLVRDGAGGAATARGRLVAFREAQRRLGRTLRAAPTTEHREHVAARGGPEHEPPWLVTDLVTLGSPLASVGFLARHGESWWGAADRDEQGSDEERAGLEAGDVRRPASSPFELKLSAREYPSCPPQPQTSAALDPSILFSGFPLRYPAGEAGSAARRRHLNHAAVFAATRWTNVYFENDLVGGPVAAQLGRGVLDVQLPVAPPTPRSFASAFSHTSYWNTPTVARLATPAATSRAILTDLLRLTPPPADGSDPEEERHEIADVATRDDVVLRGTASAAQSATLAGLHRLATRRAAAFDEKRLADAWTETERLVRASGAAGAADIATLVDELRAGHGRRCLALVSYGELVVYRCTGDGLDRSGYRAVAVTPQDAVRRCRVVTRDSPWPGAVSLEDLDGCRTLLTSFVAG